MAWVDFEAPVGLRGCLVSLAALGAAFIITSGTAEARHHHHTGGGHHHHADAEAYEPPYSSIVVDGNSGAVLQATNPDALRHPASLSKVMTLYLLFERLDAGTMKLDSPLSVSQHAADQDPTKLDLKPGQTIRVEDAIKGIVTKSANDAAVAVAENLAGSEEAFARLMTQKAHALGMSHTTYVNASGLPDDEQITTARDQAVLGRAIQERFPNYYKYFSLEAFVYHGHSIRNHDHLLSKVEGVDGIKTGYIRASGFNLLTSVHRDGRYLVAVVMGGPSAGERDARMRELISAHIKEAAVRRTAPLIADNGESRERPKPIAFARAPMAAHTDAAPTPMVAAHAGAAAGAADPIKPRVVHTITYRTAPVQTAALAPMPMLVPTNQPPGQTMAAAPAAAQSAATTPAAAPARPSTTEIASAAPTVDLKAAAMPTEAPAKADLQSAAHAVPAALPAAAPELHAAAPELHTAAPEPRAIAPTPLPEAEFAAVERERAALVEPRPARLAVVPSAPVHAHGGWIIQIGAFDDENDAKQHLNAAQTKVRTTLAAKDPFTERIQKGDKALYRARFAGFDRATAEAACRQLKRSDIQCMAVKD